MTPEPIPVRSVSTLECRTCGAGAPVDEHFCPQCSRILALGRHGDYFAFFGLPRSLILASDDIERRFRNLSRKFHPDYFYNAPPAERLASLERSSYLNDAYRALRDPVARIEHLLAIEGIPPAKLEGQSSHVPPELLEEVFALNEELDTIRDLRESGADPERVRARLAAARQPIEHMREAHERQLQELSTRWDAQADASADDKRATLEALRERLLERSYINNLLATIEREAASLAVAASPAGSPSPVGMVVGIDLGTTNSLVAYVKNGAPVVIRNAAGDALVPSVVSFGEGGVIHVGREAEARLLTAPSRTVYSVKRFMGRGVDDVRDEAALLPFRVGGEVGGVVRLGVADREFTPPEISAFVLRELKRRAEEHFRDLGEFDFEVDRAVITVPAYFNDAQRTATRDAGRLAGLEVLRIVNEPTAASLAYGLDRRNHGTVAVYDLGGGTFDISILKVEDGVFQVLATNGDTHLGGDDVDSVLSALVLSEIAGSTALPPETIQAIRKAVIQVKWDLSDREDAEIRIASAPGLDQGYRRRIERAEFERLIRPLVDRTLAPCRQALADAGLAPTDIDDVVLVGGSTRIPLVRRLAEDLFGRVPHSDLNPDEVVAVGAAVQADILVSGRREMLLLDVTPLSLGIETMGGAVSKIVLRNSTIPASGREMFTTAVDNQTAVDIHVLQGERELVADCRSLARFRLRGIPPMPAGLPRIEVRFQIDANGILSVSARELRTKIEQSIEVKPSYGLTDEEVERMLIESFEHAEADIEARLLIDARNEADSVIFATERALQRSDFDEIAVEALGAGERERIEAALAGLRTARSSGTRTALQDATHELNHATQHLAEAVMNRSVRQALAGKHVTDV